MIIHDLDDIISAYNAKGYRIFTGNFNVNMGGIRSLDLHEDTFNDQFFLFWQYEDRWQFFTCSMTTDPGLYYRFKPLRLSGTALMQPGQHRGVYELGQHKGIPAFRQIKPIPFWRLQPEDWRDELTIAAITRGQPIGSIETERSVIAANIHRASRVRDSILVDKWSAGCQVLPTAENLDFALAIGRKQTIVRNDHTFSYTLLTESDLK